VTGGLRKWHFEGYHLYCSSYVTGMMISHEQVGKECSKYGAEVPVGD
jgi:hypothetical protein